MNNLTEKILEQFPFGPDFTFMDEITKANADGIEGHYTFKKDEVFYPSHFPGNPITPGVILIETMGHIGLISFFYYLMLIKKGISDFGHIKPVFTSCKVDFYKPVFPGEKVTVHSQKVYFRLKKLKCNAIMRNVKNEVVCKAELSGIYIETD